MQEKQRLFDKSYRQYLAELAHLDLTLCSETLGAQVAGNALQITFFGQTYRVSASGIVDSAGKPPTAAVCVVLGQYILHCPAERPADQDWVTFRDFKAAGPLVGHFTVNTNRLIAETFAGRCRALEKACEALGGQPATEDAGYDLSMKIDALPAVPIFLRFNDKDEELPAQSTILFRRSAEHYLDLDSLAIIGTYLAGSLVKFARKPPA
jgi:hypothetical protein